MDLRKAWNRLSFRFVILIVAFGLIVGIGAAAIAVTIAENAMVQSFQNNMRILRNERARAVEAELDGKVRLLRAYAVQLGTRITMKEFRDVFAGLEPEDRATVIELYTDNNPFPLGNRSALIDPGDSSAFTKLHLQRHDSLHRWAQINRVEDLLLIDLNGNIVYTIDKEADFGANVLRDDALRTSVVGDLYRRALAQVPPWESVVGDLRTYQPSNDTAALMMATAVQDVDGTVLGAAIIQIDGTFLSDVANNVNDLGETGEVFLVGQDKLARSNTRFLTNAILRQKFDSEAVARALAGFESSEIGIDYKNDRVITAYAPLTVHGLRWAIVAKIDLDEVLTPVREMTYLIAGTLAVLIFALTVFGAAAMRRVSRPLDHAVRTMNALIAGNRNVDTTFTAGIVEIDTIGTAITTFKAELERTDALIAEIKKGEAQVVDLLDASPIGVMVVSQDDEVLFANEPACMTLDLRKSDLVGQTFSFGALAAIEHEWLKLVKAAKRDGQVRDVELVVAPSEKGQAILNLSLRQITHGGQSALLIWFQDVTAQQQANEQVRTLNARLVTFLENTPDYIAIKDTHQRCLAVSQALATAVGVASWRDLLGKTVGDLLPEAYTKHIEKVEAPLISGALSDVSDETELVFGGRNMVLASRRVALKAPDGRITGVLAISRDVTEQKRAEDQVRDALEAAKLERARTEAILAGAPDPIIIVRPDSTIQYVNDQVTRVLGYAPGELIDKPLETLIPQRFLKNHGGHVKNFFAAGQARMMGEGRDLYALKKSGAEVPVSISLSPVNVGGTSLVIAAIRDITDQKVAAADLRESQQLLSGVVQNSATVIFVKRGGRYIMVNKAWEIMTGISAADAKNKTDLEIFDEVNARRIMENDATVIASRTPAEYEEPVNVGDRTIHFLSLKFPFFNEKGEVDGLCGMSTDITERFAAENAVREAKEAAETATRAKSEFLASMSHEIRTPMNGIVGMADLLAQTGLDGEQSHMVRTIRDSGNSLITIINDILDFSKIEAGKLDLDTASLSIADAVEGVATTLIPNATKKDIRIHVFVDPAIPEAVQGDIVRVRQILFNLGGNAVKFSDKKDVQIRALLKDAATARDKVLVRFEIIDQGIGISPANQAKLFQAFSQAESSTTRRFGGTGLGLTICKRLTELMGGNLGVISQEGQGSTFWVELEFAPTDNKRTHEKQRDLSDLNVLLVGSPNIRKDAITAYLTHWGATVADAATLAAAERAVSSQRKSVGKKGTNATTLDAIILDFDLDHDAQENATARLRTIQAQQRTKLPQIVLQDYQKRDARIKSDDLITVDANPLIRYRLLTAVAVAAGRASPQTAPAEVLPQAERRTAPSVEEAYATGQLILLAEDNPTNQDVIKRQLNVLGYTCETADDGRQGLEAYRSGRYAMILTDCHMPEMDGYEMTGKIRGIEAGSNRRIPIVAVTANALQGEAERCIAAGMDDYISKPIAMPILQATLQKWMPRVDDAADEQPAQSAQDAPPPATQPSDHDTDTPIDSRAIKDMFGDDPIIYKEVLLSFVDPSKGIVDDLLASVGQKDANGVRNAAHKLKSAARTVGANALADTCVELETAAKNSKWKTISTLAPETKVQLSAVIAYVEAL